MAEWDRVLQTTIHKFMKGAEVNILRKRRLTALLREEGRIEYGQSGDLVQWEVEYRQIPMQTYADMGTLTFARQSVWRQCQLDWRGYAATDAISKKEKEMNKGEERIIDLWGTKGERVKRSMENQFGPELYQDGNATGELGIHGIESFFGVTGTGQSNGIVLPSDTYAGLKTDTGSYGGTWSGTWPDGTDTSGTESYDFFSPIVVAYLHATAWGGSAFDTWAENADKVLRAGFIYSQRSKAMDGQLTLVLVDAAMYRDALNLIDDKERIVVNRGDKSKLTAIGFNDVFNIDGVDVSWEHGIPASVGYGFNIQQMGLRSLQSQLFVSDDIDYDPASQSWRIAVVFLGNAWFNPRYFVKWLNST